MADTDVLVAQARLLCDSRSLPDGGWKELALDAIALLGQLADRVEALDAEAEEVVKRLSSVHQSRAEEVESLCARVEALEGDQVSQWEVASIEHDGLTAQVADLTARLGDALRALNVLYEGGPSAMAIRVASDPANRALLESLREADHAGR